MKHGAVKCLLVLLAGLVLYIAIFSYLWLRNPAYTGTSVSGRECRYVDFKYDKFTARTALLWNPGLWFMEHVCGYEHTATVAAYDKTIIFYGKPK